jgi:hypothetical protein
VASVDACKLKSLNSSVALVLFYFSAAQLLTALERVYGMYPDIVPYRTVRPNKDKLIVIWRSRGAAIRLLDAFQSFELSPPPSILF